MLMGRLLISATFIVEAVVGGWCWEAGISQLAGKGFQMVALLQAGLIATQLIGGLALLFGVKTRLAALSLTLFLASTTAIFHPFWLSTGHTMILEIALFSKNCAVLGGLLYILAVGSGVFSLDHRKSKRVVEPEE